MDFVVAVARHVLAELFKIASLPRLPLRVDAEFAAAEEKRRDVFPLVEKIRIDAQLGARRLARAHRPETQRRGDFEIGALEKILPAPVRRDRPVEPRNRGVRRQQRGAVVRLGGDLARKSEADAEQPRGERFVVDADFEHAGPVFLQAAPRPAVARECRRVAPRARTASTITDREQPADEEHRNQQAHPAPSRPPRRTAARSARSRGGAGCGGRSWENPKSEIRNPKQIRTSEILKKGFIRRPHFCGRSRRKCSSVPGFHLQSLL